MINDIQYIYNDVKNITLQVVSAPTARARRRARTRTTEAESRKKAEPGRERRSQGSTLHSNRLLDAATMRGTECPSQSMAHQVPLCLVQLTPLTFRINGASSKMGIMFDPAAPTLSR
jgi:hypothetical protein